MGNLKFELYRPLLLKLEVLTDLTEFALSRMEAGSSLTASWCSVDQLAIWQERIGAIRSMLPEEEVEKFDDDRKREGHRENCQCIICEERRGDT